MRSSRFLYAMLLPLCGMTLLGAGFTSRRRITGVLLLGMIVVGLLFTARCGGGSSSSTNTGGGSGGTPSGNYVVTVTGTSGSISQTSTFALTVQ